MITGTATNNAGLSATASATVNIDKPPVITASVSPAPNAAGWNNSNVTVTFTATDGGSGLARLEIYNGTSLVLDDTAAGAMLTDDVVVTTEGEYQVITGTATDSHGLTATTQVILNIDKTAPVIVINTNPLELSSLTTDGAWYTLGEAVDTLPVVTVTDNFPAGLTVTPALDVPVLFSYGTYPVTITATDAAGNTSTATLDVSVSPDDWFLVPDDITAEATGPDGAHVDYPPASI